MNQEVSNVAVLGSTGSIGQSTLEVIAASCGRLRVAALSAHSRLDELVEQARRFRPRWLVASDPLAAAVYDQRGSEYFMLGKIDQAIAGQDRNNMALSHSFYLDTGHVTAQVRSLLGEPAHSPGEIR